MLENKEKANISDLGEFGLIKHLTENIKLKNKSSKKGVGDDCAVISNKKQTLVSTDLLVEGIHFDLMYVPLKHLGYKAVSVNVSDIYAMNGKPEQITVSIAVSSKITLDAVEELYEGIQLACDNFEVDLVGGDTTSSVTGFMISVTAIGSVDEKKIAYRSGAKENDLVCVSGDLGAAYLGLQVLEREKQVFKENSKIQPDLSGHDYIVERQLKPEARMDIIEKLDKLKIVPTSMIDISDGLASELHHICEQSECGANIYAEKIPIDHTASATAQAMQLDPTVCALNGGEDYELLFTINQRDFEKVKNETFFSIIGHVTTKESGLNLVTEAGSSIPLTAQGWNSLKEE
jgi:thiamine-monophosphate kinase